MPADSRDPRVDAYIAAAAPFAQPILTHIRAVVHAACPEATETIKWRMPTFEYRGILCLMAAFRGHCALAFWKGGRIEGLQPRSAKGGDGMGQLGRITSLADLPSTAVLTRYVKEAVRLKDAGDVPTTPRRAAKPAAVVPPDLAAALAKDAAATQQFARFSPSQRREYIDWIIEAKRPETRARRIAQTVAQAAEGKTQNWKY